MVRPRDLAAVKLMTSSERRGLFDRRAARPRLLYLSIQAAMSLPPTSKPLLGM